MPSRVLVTGANGYLGERCIERLSADRGRDVVALWHRNVDRLPSNPPSHLRIERCDLRDPAAVTEVVRRHAIDTIIHTAVLLPDGRADYVARAAAANVLATANLVAAAVESGCRRFVYCSTISVYGATQPPPDGWDESEPIAARSSYGWSKYAGEECLRLHSGEAMTGISLRLAGIHGGARRSGVLVAMARAALSGEPLIVNHPADRFQFLSLDDAVEAILCAAELPLPPFYHCVNVASHVFASMEDVALRVIERCGTDASVERRGTASGAEYVMNLGRMATLLRITPGDVGITLQAIVDSLKAERLGLAG